MIPCWIFLTWLIDKLRSGVLYTCCRDQWFNIKLSLPHDIWSYASILDVLTLHSETFLCLSIIFDVSFGSPTDDKPIWWLQSGTRLYIGALVLRTTVNCSHSSSVCCLFNHERNRPLFNLYILSYSPCFNFASSICCFIMSVHNF